MPTLPTYRSVARIASVRYVAVAFSLALLILVNVPAGRGAPAHENVVPLGTPGPPATTSVSVSVTFDGEPTTAHSDPGQAISTTFDSHFAVDFNWSAHGGQLGSPTQVTVTGAQLILKFLGLAAFTDQVNERAPVTASTGALNLTADFTQDRFLVEGIYLLTTVLLGANSSTVWSGDLYIHVSAPYHLVGLNVVIVGLILFEVYTVLSIGRQPRRERPTGTRAPLKE
jgi:hypothetical protein